MARTILFGVAFVVIGNGLIHLWMSHLHREVRAAMRGAPIFEENDDALTVRASAMLAWSLRFAKADVVVTPHAVVLFQRNFVIKQPPIQLLRSAADPARVARAQVVHVVVEHRATIDEEGRVEIEGQGRWRFSRWKLSLTTARAKALVAALERWRTEVGPTTYRASR